MLILQGRTGNVESEQGRRKRKNALEEIAKAKETKQDRLVCRIKFLKCCSKIVPPAISPHSIIGS